MYGAECWLVTKKHKQGLCSMEMNMLTEMLELTQFHRIMTKDIQERMGIAPVAEKMREAQLQSCSRFIRSKNQTVAKSAMRIR